MSMEAVQPVRTLEHSHARLNDLTLEIGRLLRGESHRPSPRIREALIGLTEELRDTLLEHFANEEEGLFPFVRRHVPSQIGTIDRLEAAHDTISDAIVRLVYLIDPSQPTPADALVVYGRFESAQAAHVRDEAGLFDELKRTLTPGQQSELAEHLRGLG